MNIPSEKFIENLTTKADRSKDKKLKKLLKEYEKGNVTSTEELFQMEVRERLAQQKLLHDHIMRNQPITKLQDLIDKIDEDLISWTEKFKQHSAYHLKWGDDILVQAVKKEIYIELLQDFITLGVSKEVFDNFIQRCTNQALSSASYINNRSTSPMSNLIDDARTSAFAKIAQDKNMDVLNIKFWFNNMKKFNKEEQAISLLNIDFSQL
jgi:hypothetical protein